MGKEYGNCERTDCFANINYGTGNKCKALDVPYENKCPFYKKDVDGQIRTKIEKDIKMYAGKEDE